MALIKCVKLLFQLNDSKSVGKNNEQNGTKQNENEMEKHLRVEVLISVLFAGKLF